MGSIIKEHYVRPGFSFLEILVALLVIAILLHISYPRIRYVGTHPIDEYAEQVQKLTRLAYISTITSGKLHRLWFQMLPPLIRIEQAQTKKQDNSPLFTPLPRSFVPTQVELPEQIVVEHFFIKGIDEAAAGHLQEAWFYIFPAGLTQEIIITIRDTESGEIRSLVLNPFSVKFTLYDTPQTP